MTAGRWTPNIATRRLAERTSVIFEFQREIANGEWKALGLARTAADNFDVGGAVRVETLPSSTEITRCSPK